MEKYFAKICSAQIKASFTNIETYKMLDEFVGFKNRFVLCSM